MTEVQIARRVEGLVGINGKNVWGDIKQYVEDITFSESASGETDSFDITVKDSDAHFISDWMVDKGTLLESKLKICNQNGDLAESWIDCGEFLVDRIQVKAYPVSVTIQALALPQSGTKNTRKWENISIRAIAADICGRLGCPLEYLTEDITLKSRQQSRQTDIDFLYNLCKEYGFGMKVYRRKIVIFGREAADAAEAVNTYNINDIASSYSIDDNEDGTYTGVSCTYKPEGSDTDINYSYGGGDRILNLDISAASAQEAELKARAALYDANIEAVRLRFTAPGGITPIYAGTNHYITGLGGYSGKYAIDKAEHRTSGKSAYTVSVEAHAIALEKDRVAADEAANVALAAGDAEAGKEVNLTDCPLYVSSDAKTPVRNVTGTYYLYDGKSFGGRYRICPKGNIGEKPVGANVTGYVQLTIEN